MGTIKIERIYGSAKAEGTIRILVDRIWPRGITKEDAAIDGWWKNIAPSPDLRKWFGHDPVKYDAFKARYLAELDRNEYAADCKSKIAASLRTHDVVLLYAAKDTDHNNAVVLKEWLRGTTEG